MEVLCRAPSKDYLEKNISEIETSLEQQKEKGLNGRWFDTVLIGAQGHREFTHRVQLSVCSGIARLLPEYLQDEDEVVVLLPDWSPEHLSRLRVFVTIGRVLANTKAELGEFVELLGSLGVETDQLSTSCINTPTGLSTNEIGLCTSRPKVGPSRREIMNILHDDDDDDEDETANEPEEK